MKESSAFNIKLLHKATIMMVILCCFCIGSNAEIKTSIISGNFMDPQSWNPYGSPAEDDDVIISDGHIITVNSNTSINKVTVNFGGMLTWNPSFTLTINNDLEVHGTAEMNSGNIQFQNGNKFILGDQATFIWEPGNNNAAGASLFINGIESFNDNSNLIINKWYNYTSVPLGSVVSGSFGNLTLNTLTNGLLFEWDQNNEFESHPVNGKLTIGQAWIVLDKSGSISVTEIGSIELNNINSFLDIHHGTHPGSFLIKTNSITNIGGTFNGIYNGDGDINLEVSGDIINLGYMELIYNSGVTGVGNGDIFLEVDGTFIQHAGDFRGIFNLSSTLSGKINFILNDVELYGGVFMGQYACHTDGQQADLHIRGDLKIDYTDVNSKFRINGLNTLAGTQSDLKLHLQIDGTVETNGPSSSEITTSGSAGTEEIILNGDLHINGCELNFNYGDHSTSITSQAGLFQTGGSIFLSKTRGTLNASFNEDVIISGGNFIVKGASGNAGLEINGECWISGGNILLHDNTSEPSSNSIYVKIFGDYFHTSGSLIFDNNPNSTILNSISINSRRYIIGGNATIASATKGNLYFDRIGELDYIENGTNHTTDNIVQFISSGCILNIKNGDLQISAGTSNVDHHLVISEHAELKLNNSQVYTKSNNPHSVVRVEDSGIISTKHANGLINATEHAAINSSSGVSISLSQLSIIVYNGGTDQVITGFDGTNNNTKYGTLRIDLEDDISKAKLINNKVFIRNRIELVSGGLLLKEHTLTLESGSMAALIYDDGYFVSENITNSGNGSLRWLNLEPGSHTVPFSNMNGEQVHISFDPIDGLGNYMTLSTSTTTSNNRPLPYLTAHGNVEHLTIDGSEAGETRIIDRWFVIEAPGVEANLTLSYLGKENTTSPEVASKSFNAMVWNDHSWKPINGSSVGTISGNGFMNIYSNKTWGAICLASINKPALADLLDFNAEVVEKQVNLTWKSKSNIPVQKFIVQRSSDGIYFKDIGEVNASANSIHEIQYRDYDIKPLTGTSYYKIKQVNLDGSHKYSIPVKIEFTDISGNYFQVLTLGPNPFDHGFNSVVITPPDRDIVELTLFNASGQIVFSKRYEASGSYTKIEFNDGSQLTPGIYIANITDGRNNITKKLYKK